MNYSEMADFRVDLLIGKTLSLEVSSVMEIYRLLVAPGPFRWTTINTVLNLS